MATLLTLEQAAQRLGIHVTTIRAWVRGGRIPAFRLGRRFVRVDWEAVLRTLKDEAECRAEEGAEQ